MRGGMYTTAEAAELLGISKPTLLRRVKDGAIVPDRMDRETGYCQFSRETLEGYAAARYECKASASPAASSAPAAFTFIDLFAGIGGIRLGFEAAGGECVFSSEIDRWAAKTYSHMFRDRKEHEPAGDITKIAAEDIPAHDVLCGGFPCQPFSLAGVSKYNALGLEHGFSHPTKGTLFFDIVRILHHHRPKAFFLENVKNLRNHDGGRTWKTIKQSLRDLGYDVYAQIFDAQLVVPQHRERIFIVGIRHDLGVPFMFPAVRNRHPRLRDILDPDPDPKYTLTPRLWEYLQAYAAKHAAAGHGFGYGIADPDGVTRTLSARYHKDGSEILIAQPRNRPRRLTPAECARLQGFPEPWQHPVVSDTQAYRQFGNAVAVPLIEEVAKALIGALQSAGVLQGGETFPANMEDVETLRMLYPAGTRIQVISMDDPAPVPPGTTGTVSEVDDAGQIAVRWDGGRTLRLAPGSDRFRVLKPGTEVLID